jgi:hypothetical protein
MADTIEYSHKHQIRPGDRLFEALNHALIIISALGHGASILIGGTTHTHPKPAFRTATRWPDLAFGLPMRGPLEMALQDRQPDLIEIGVLTNPEHITDPIKNIKIRTRGFESVMAHLMSPLFIIYFERYLEWLKANLGDRNNWPAVLDFARVVRNAAAHGKIDFRDPDGPEVSWRDLTYGYKDRGRVIIGTDLSIGEMLALMFETNEALDKLSAPVL